MDKLALRPKFPDRLKIYNREGHNFRIFVNDEFDSVLKALICRDALELEKVKTKDRNETPVMRDFALMLEQSGIDFNKFIYIYVDRALKLMVISNGNDNTSRELTIGSDIKDAAMDFTRGYSSSFWKCIELYKHFGLNCNINDIQFRNPALCRLHEDKKNVPHMEDVKIILAKRKRDKECK